MERRGGRRTPWQCDHSTYGCGASGTHAVPVAGTAGFAAHRPWRRQGTCCRDAEGEGAVCRCCGRGGCCQQQVGNECFRARFSPSGACMFCGNPGTILFSVLHPCAATGRGTQRSCVGERATGIMSALGALERQAASCWERVATSVLHAPAAAEMPLPHQHITKHRCVLSSCLAE
jgi:hypothetical protein